MGCRKADEAVNKLIAECVAELDGKLAFKVCYTELPISHKDGLTDLTFMQTKSSLPCFALISNIIRNTLGDFMWKYRWNIRFKKYGISNQPNGCIFDDPCLSKFGALHGSCPHSGRQFVGLLCVSLMGTRQQMA